MRVVPIFALAIAIWWAAPAMAVDTVTQPPTALHDAATLPASPWHVDGSNRCDTRLLAGRGCCSYHKGQCGCQKGRVVCCDGTLSPSCRCAADDRNVTK